jgi:hypothetical protein
MPAHRHPTRIAFVEQLRGGQLSAGTIMPRLDVMPRYFHGRRSEVLANGAGCGWMAGGPAR